MIKITKICNLYKSQRNFDLTSGHTAQPNVLRPVDMLHKSESCSDPSQGGNKCKSSQRRRQLRGLIHPGVAVFALFSDSCTQRTAITQCAVHSTLQLSTTVATMGHVDSEVRKRNWLRR